MPSLTMATIGVKGPTHADLMLRAVEAGLRAGLAAPELSTLRVELMNMRWRAYLGEWAGWGDGGWDCPPEVAIHAPVQTATWKDYGRG